MRADKMTSKFQQALAEAQSRALGLDNQFIEPAHLMSALLEQDGSTVRQILGKTGVDVASFRKQLNDALARLPKVEGVSGDVHPSNELVRVLNLTDKLAQKRNDSFISSELFLLAVLQDNGELGRLLQRVGADPRLRRSSAPGTVYQTDRHIQLRI